MHQSLVRKLLDAGGQGPQVAEWERDLNALVYELYGVTEEEIGVVEGVWAALHFNGQPGQPCLNPGLPCN